MDLQQFSCMSWTNMHEWKQGTETVKIHSTVNFKEHSVYNVYGAKQQSFDQISA